MKKMKIFLSLFLLLVVGTTILIYQHKNPNMSSSTNSDMIKVRIGNSKKFTRDEINDAVYTVKEKFNFKGCKLTDIWYSEKEALSITEGYMQAGKGMDNGVKEKNVIVLLSTFKVDSSGGDGSWEPNSTQDSYSWTLIRDSKQGKWRIDDSGYN